MERQPLSLEKLRKIIQEERMNKLDYMIQSNYEFFSNLNPNFSHNFEIRKKFLNEKNKTYITELSLREYKEMEKLLLPQN